MSKIMNQEKFDLAKQCLIDNGIENDEVETVLQALVYIICDEETVQYMSFAPYMCMRCGNRFDNMVSLEDHITEQHTL